MELTMSPRLDSEKTKTSHDFWTVYKPLILVAAFTVGVTALIEINFGDFVPDRAMNSVTTAANSLTIVLMLIGNYSVWLVLKRKGTIFNLPMTKVTLFENFTMLAMAVMALVAA